MTSVFHMTSSINHFISINLQPYIKLEKKLYYIYIVYIVYTHGKYPSFSTNKLGGHFAFPYNLFHGGEPIISGIHLNRPIHGLNINYGC